MNEEILKSFELYKKRSNELRSNKDFYTNLVFKIKWDRGKVGKAHFDKFPDEKTIKSFALDLRPFMLQNEAIHYPRICNVLLGYYKNDHKVVKDLREAKNNGLTLLEGARL